MGLFKVSAVNGVRKKLLGAGNVYFYHGQAGNEWAAGGVSKSGKTPAGSLGVLQKLQNAIATELRDYLRQMRAEAEKRFNGIEFSDYHASSPSIDPIGGNFFDEVLRRGKNMEGVFGNKSGHARYVEWGTGPMGAEGYPSLTPTMRRLNEKPTYRETPWVYYNADKALSRLAEGDNTLNGFVTTKGMKPRPFVYPAFLRYKGAFIRDLDLICKGKTGASDFMSSWQIGNG